MSLKLIKNKIRSVDKTHTVTKAMEAVSAVKMRKSQERALEGRTYARSALTILKRVSGSFDASHHPLAEMKDSGKTLVVVVTSDKGLAGSLNNAVLKRTVRLIEESGFQKDTLGFLCLGKKGYEFFTKRGHTILLNQANISDEVSSLDMKEVTAEIVRLFTKEEYDECYILYTNFKSTFEQEAVVRKILPLSVEAIAETVEGIIPEKGKFKEEKEEEVNIREYTVEPNAEEVIDELLPFLLNIEVYHALLEAKASEHSARMVAMKSASDKAEEMSKDLNLEFNKARQALITREVSEIIGGMETLTT